MSRELMTWDEMKARKFPHNDYEYPFEEGIVGVSLAAKSAGQQNNLIAYFDTDDGEYIKVSIWDDTPEYATVMDMETGEHALLTLGETRSGRIRVEGVSMEEVYEQ